MWLMILDIWEARRVPPVVSEVLIVDFCGNVGVWTVLCGPEIRRKRGFPTDYASRNAGYDFGTPQPGKHIFENLRLCKSECLSDIDHTATEFCR